MSVESGGLRDRNGLFSAQDARDEAIAVVGVSCRLPKASDPRSFWEMLRSGGHGLDEPPTNRRTHGAGPSRAGYIDGVADFDAAFFGISPREAVAMDPQQRIVLELAWEALEDANIVPETIEDTPTGVFVGSLRDDYAVLVGKHGDEAITQNTMTGISRGLIANRVSHHLGLTGPSLTVDAAQASSLVAVHMACTSLRGGSLPWRWRPGSTSTSFRRTSWWRSASEPSPPMVGATPSTRAPTGSSGVRVAVSWCSSPWTKRSPRGVESMV